MIFISTDLLILLLFFILIFSFSLFTFRKFLKDRGTPLIASLAISLIATAYLSYSQFSFISKVYGLTGTLTLLLIPTVTLFFFIYSSNINNITRRLFWILYGIIMMSLLNRNIISNSGTDLIKIGIIIITLLVLIFDKKIKNIFNTKKNLRGAD